MLVRLSSTRRACAAGGVVAVLVAVASLVSYGAGLRRPVAALNPGVAPVGAKTACIYPRQTISILDQLQQVVGRTYDCVIVYNDAAPDWNGWEQPWFTVQKDEDLNWANWVKAAAGRKLVIGQNMVPDGVPADWAARGAAGEYDAHARTLAENLVSAGLGDSIIRLGHEANGTWKNDKVGTTTKDQKAWRTYWARIAGVMKSVPGASFRFDWNISAWYRDIPLENYYPGDDAVDIVGIDFYDGSPNPRQTYANADDRWQTQYDWVSGPAEVIAFADRHHKPLSIPEWGLVKPTDGGAGDNPTYIDNMAALVRDNNVSYEAYWVNDSSMILPLSSDVPRSLAAYRAHFGTGGDAAGGP
jgi:hypothetical protein